MKDIEIVEPTEEERRALFTQKLTVEQQIVVSLLEQCITAVAARGPGTISADQNPVFKHPYQRSAVRALEMAHSSVLNWYGRLNRGLHVDVSWPLKPDEPEKQE